MSQPEKHLELVLKTRWYRMIESGEKQAEYRDLKPYWWNRIFVSKWPLFTIVPAAGPQKGNYSTVRFRLGYGKNAEAMIWKLGHVGVGYARPEWAEGHMNKVIVLPLVERLDKPQAP